MFYCLILAGYNVGCYLGEVDDVMMTKHSTLFTDSATYVPDCLTTCSENSYTGIRYVWLHTAFYIMLIFNGVH